MYSRTIDSLEMHAIKRYFNFDLRCIREKEIHMILVSSHGFEMSLNLSQRRVQFLRPHLQM